LVGAEPPNAVPLSVQAAESFRYSFLHAAVLPCSPIITLCSHASLLYLSKVPASLSTRIARFIALSKTRRRGASVCGPEFRAVARVFFASRYKRFLWLPSFRRFLDLHALSLRSRGRCAPCLALKPPAGLAGLAVLSILSREHS
jgi:hypothetical protein